MRVRFEEFSARKFSFLEDPVLVLEEFWTPEEQAFFLEAMNRTKWKALREMPAVSKAFPDCGNWLKGEIAPAEADVLLGRLSLPCITEYIDSFPDVMQRHMSFAYYSYSAGDSLSTHDDTDEAYFPDRQTYRALRRLACVSYMHTDWKPDWGGELIAYEGGQDKQGNRVLEISHCVAPKPRSLAFFTVPRFHRVCRWDTLAGPHKRLSITGWFMTEHFASEPPLPELPSR